MNTTITNRCQGCNSQTETRKVEFHQNIGILFRRFYRKFHGDLCADCIEKYFWEYTGITFLFGWWGIISFFMTPFILIINLVNYIKTIGLKRKFSKLFFVAFGWKLAIFIPIFFVVIIYITPLFLYKPALIIYPTISPSTNLLAILPTSVSTPVPTSTDILNIQQIDNPFPAVLTELGNPVNGILTDSNDNEVATNCSGVKIADFVAEATFTNPDSASHEKWDYGFIFRNDDNKNEYRIIVTQKDNWSLENWISGKPYLIASGSLDLLTNTNQTNHLKLIVLGDQGYLYNNDELVTSLDLRAIKTAGNLCIATDMISEDHLAKKNTPFLDYTVWSIKTDYLPTGVPSTTQMVTPFPADLSLLGQPIIGKLFHINNDMVAYNCFQVNLADFVTEADFTNPYTTDNGKWDYGFYFRYSLDTDSLYKIIISSNGTWNLLKRVGSQSTNVASGTINLQNGDLETNHLKLITLGNRGYFYLNDKLVSSLDLSALKNSGDVCVATGIFTGDTIPGNSTPFENFSVWSINTK